MNAKIYRAIVNGKLDEFFREYNRTPKKLMEKFTYDTEGKIAFSKDITSTFTGGKYTSYFQEFRDKSRDVDYLFNENYEPANLSMVRQSNELFCVKVSNSEYTTYLALFNFGIYTKLAVEPKFFIAKNGLIKIVGVNDFLGIVAPKIIEDDDDVVDEFEFDLKELINTNKNKTLKLGAKAGIDNSMTDDRINELLKKYEAEQEKKPRNKMIRMHCNECDDIYDAYIYAKYCPYCGHEVWN